MDKEKKEKILWVLGEISKDAEQDIKDLEGKPFNGHNMASFCGKQNAMIQGLANILKEVVSNA